MPLLFGSPVTQLFAVLLFSVEPRQCYQGDRIALLLKASNLGANQVVFPKKETLFKGK